MFKTADQITDPVEYIRSYPDLLAHEQLVISGSDFDVMVKQLPEGKPPNAIGRIDEHESAFLGSLYPSGKAMGEAIDDKFINLYWYPSPDYVNKLAEQLDLRPGEDVLRFAHSSAADKFSRTPSVIYGHYLANGEYPQSTNHRYFLHDRNDDHAVGVFLAPREFTQSVIRIAVEAKAHKKEKNRISETKLLTGEFDMATNGLGRFIEAYMKDSVGEISFPGDYLYYHHMRGFFREPRKNKKAEKVSLSMTQLVLGHLEELTPKVQALQADKELATNKA